MSFSRRVVGRGDTGKGQSEPRKRRREELQPSDELEPRQFAACEKGSGRISRQTIKDHYKLYEDFAKKANECRRIPNEFD
jgi:hypothetical protein